MFYQKITNLADGTNPNYAVNFKQLYSLEDKIRALDEKYIKREVNMVGGYANMMAMPVVNLAPSADFSSAVNL